MEKGEEGESQAHVFLVVVHKSWSLVVVMKWLCCICVTQILLSVLRSKHHRCYCMEVSVQLLAPPPFFNFWFFLYGWYTWTPIFLRNCYLHFGLGLPVNSEWLPEAILTASTSSFYSFMIYLSCDICKKDKWLLIARLWGSQIWHVLFISKYILKFCRAFKSHSLTVASSILLVCYHLWHLLVAFCFKSTIGTLCA